MPLVVYRLWSCRCLWCLLLLMMMSGMLSAWQFAPMGMRQGLRAPKLGLRLFSSQSQVHDSLSSESPVVSPLTSLTPAQVDQHFMKLAIRQAQAAYRDKEVPIGAVLVDRNGTVLSAARNQVENDHDASAHAEINCLRKASQVMGNWRLQDCTLYTTLEPCGMCLSAIQHFRIKRVVFSAKDLRLGACGSFIDLLSIKHPFHTVQVDGGLLQEESTMLLRRFFQGLRSEKSRYASHDLGRGCAHVDFPLVDENTSQKQ